MAAGNLTRGVRQRRYRRRRPLPALILMVLLAMVAGVVWLRVIKSDQADARATACDPPPATAADGSTPAPLGQTMERTGLDRAGFNAPSTSLVRVVNASGQNRQAGAVTETLRDLGYAQIADPTNDTVYPAGSLNCRSQIRFGQQGMAAARTLHILEPCAELVRDERQDATVDFAVGRKFDHLKPTPESRRIVEIVTEWAQSNPDQGGLLADGSTAAPVPDELVHGALDVRCQ